tara:strand:- start:3176 stop:3790 length:615 start_codon:yes stop_codon:yes gene_type:complete
MKIINCEQGTDEWLIARLGKATASCFSKIITSTGTQSQQFQAYAHLLASEVLTGKPEETFKSYAMELGNENEFFARNLYQEQTLSVVQEVGFIDCGEYGCSPDGLVGDKGLIEIKCPLAATHTKYLFKNQLPSEYFHQVQGALYCTGREWCDFVSYNPNFNDDLQLLIVRVERDEKFITALSEGIERITEVKQSILKKVLNDRA